MQPEGLSITVGTVLLATAVAATTQSAAQRLPLLPGDEPLALTNARVVDVRGGTVSPISTLVVRAGRIERIQQVAPPSGIKVLDLENSYLVPGLIDAHAHVSTLEAAQRALTSGVTTIRTAGVPAFEDVGLRELARQSPVAAPESMPPACTCDPSCRSRCSWRHPLIGAWKADSTIPPPFFERPA